MDLLKKSQNFIKYWYTRYLLCTELYMVEQWETVVIHILFSFILGLFWYINHYYVVGPISYLRCGGGPMGKFPDGGKLFDGLAK